VHNLVIGENTAEGIKCSAGSAYPLEQEFGVAVTGRDSMSGKPKEIEISTVEIREKVLAAPIQTIIDAVMNLLRQTPPELMTDIYNVGRGIWLSGGGALLRGLDKRIEEETGLKVHIPTDPLLAVAQGTGIVLDHLNEYRSVLLKHNTYL
jgi:rod shape-determining protein MreB